MTPRTFSVLPRKLQEALRKQALKDAKRAAKRQRKAHVSPIEVTLLDPQVPTVEASDDEQREPRS